MNVLGWNDTVVFSFGRLSMEELVRLEEEEVNPRANGKLNREVNGSSVHTADLAAHGEDFGRETCVVVCRERQNGLDIIREEVAMSDNVPLTLNERGQKLQPQPNTQSFQPPNHKKRQKGGKQIDEALREGLGT
ncbi:hypothetical protein Scep_009108 [Stephania cephalantha]|uniref:Uncharacterized protein n=1 Tax=Stephania cephalantha TaxID=152367 RepID=A0AAP0JUX8_9MAGN